MNTSYPNMPQWEQNLRAVLDRFFVTPEAVGAVASMWSAIRTTNAVLVGGVTDESRNGVARMLIDWAYGMGSNPFCTNFAHRFMPIFAAAVNAYIDALGYMVEAAELPNDPGQTFSVKATDLRSRAVTCKGYIYELATTCLLCEQGGAVYKDKARALRDALMGIEDQI